MFTQQEKKWTSKRLVYTGDKSSYTSHTASGVGYFRQLDDSASALNQIQIGTGFKLIVEGSDDIIATDKIEIENVEYEVKGVKLEEFGSISIKELLLTKKSA